MWPKAAGLTYYLLTTYLLLTYYLLTTYLLLTYYLPEHVAEGSGTGGAPVLGIEGV